MVQSLEDVVADAHTPCERSGWMETHADMTAWGSSHANVHLGEKNDYIMET